MRILAVGDVHGNFDTMVKLMEAHKPGLCLQVGDLETIRDDADLEQISGPKKYRRVKSFPPFWSGEKKIPVPTLFISGNHESFGQLEEHDPERKLYPYIIPNLRYFGRWGVLDIGNGITIAGLSGNFSEVDFEESSDQRRKRGDASGWHASRGNSHFRRDEVESLIEACRGRTIDILLTHEWPAGLISAEESERLASLWKMDAAQILSYGKAPIRELLHALNPTYHFCGHIHRRYEGQIGKTKVICLGIITTGEDAGCVIEIPNKYEEDPGIHSPLAGIRHLFSPDYDGKIAKVMRMFKSGEKITDQTFLDMGLNPISTAPLEFDPWDHRKRQTKYF